MGIAYSMRLDELIIIDLCFLHVLATETPLIAVLFEDIRRSRYVRVYSVDLDMKELKKGTRCVINKNADILSLSCNSIYVVRSNVLFSIVARLFG
jgi:hypothetical protein